MIQKLNKTKTDFLKWAKKMLPKEDYKSAVAFAQREFKKRKEILKNCGLLTRKGE